MSSILDQILAEKRVEVDARKAAVPYRELERNMNRGRKPVSLKTALRAGSGIIAEMKRKSPSLGVINDHIDAKALAEGYTVAGASAISVLTDGAFFGGSLSDLQAARAATPVPLLRKDFIIDEYQLAEAAANGADAVLLIAAALSPARLHQLRLQALQFGMEALVEVHDLPELKAALGSGADLIGVNNRNLSTFDVDLDISRSLAGEFPDEVVRVAESGIESPEAIRELRGLGYVGFLIGGYFMKGGDPGARAAEFIRQLGER
jgi:indole-3-glycerol phosphate synthase